MTQLNAQWFRRHPDELATQLNTDPHTGLTAADAAARLARDGPNVLVEAQAPGLWRRIGHHLRDVTAMILLVAVGLATYLALTTDSGWVKPLVIGAIVALNVGISVFQEGRAEQALASLKAMNPPSVTVIRGGQAQTVPASALVVGDVISLRPGDTVPADARVLTATALSVDEAMLTGESEAVGKDRDEAPALYSGTAVLTGQATAMVVGVGMATELGQIARMLTRTAPVQTPLARRLDQLGKRLSLVAVLGGLLTIALVLGLYQDSPAEGLMLGIGLAIAAVPESLPVIVTLSLTAGVQTMARQHAIVRRMPAVETIGNVTVIASDKTGTLTQNRMTVTRFWPGQGPAVAAADATIAAQSQLWALASAVRPAADGTLTGSPTDIAVTRFVAEHVPLADVQARYPQVAEAPFDSATKHMATLHRDGAGYLAVVKGAPDWLALSGASAPRQAVHDEMAEAGLRVLAAGVKYFDTDPGPDWQTHLTDLTPLGLVGIVDPPRPEVPAAIATAQAAGIRTVMITGDHLATAEAIGRQIGLLPPGALTLTGAELAALDDAELAAVIDRVHVFARTTPADKLRIVQAWQARGEVVAMTGDGVNDAPALRQADVGVAMGITGTEVAKNAADIVLTDDNFATIVGAVRQGRTVYQNIVKAVEFLVSVNFAQIFTMIVAVAIGWGAPLSAEQMLIVNLLADGIPGMFLNREPAEAGLMAQPPLPRTASLWGAGLGRRVAVRTATYVVLILGVYALGRFGPAGSPALGVTMLFLVLAIGSVLDLFAIKTRQRLTRQTLRTNPALTISCTVIILSLIALVSVPALGAWLGLVPLTLTQWGVVGLTSVLPLIVVETYKRWQHRDVLAHWQAAADAD
ncbi:cation-translocating P-type ATPase [Lacticaseibacillus absianus]|uniref:cation-translocating P-type ATPase n=1 Tax=Lacticaseibacillus absianus TaxID=2729623 RepID=UPI0015CBE2B8|nr:cation-translocating P-type ATPase [Lacticaseibacillus absianus]